MKRYRIIAIDDNGRQWLLDIPECHCNRCYWYRKDTLQRAVRRIRKKYGRAWLMCFWKWDGRCLWWPRPTQWCASITEGMSPTTVVHIARRCGQGWFRYTPCDDACEQLGANAYSYPYASMYTLAKWVAWNNSREMHIQRSVACHVRSMCSTKQGSVSDTCIFFSDSATASCDHTAHILQAARMEFGLLPSVLCIEQYIYRERDIH